jgi:hypothetical protein
LRANSRLFAPVHFVGYAQGFFALRPFVAIRACSHLTATMAENRKTSEEAGASALASGWLMFSITYKT